MYSDPYASPALIIDTNTDLLGAKYNVEPSQLFCGQFENKGIIGEKLLFLFIPFLVLESEINILGG